MTTEHDYIKLSSGKKYAYGQIIGISLDQKDVKVYSGYDNHVGEFDGELTYDEKMELAWLMITRWANFIRDMEK